MLFTCTSINANTIKFFSSEDLGGIEKMSPCTVKLRFCYQITGRIGKGEPCKELAFQCLKIEKCNKVSDFNLNNVANDQCKIIVEQQSPNEIALSYLAYDVTSEYFEVTKELKLPLEICKDFGVNSLIILPGKYMSKKDSSGIWTTIFKVK